MISLDGSGPLYDQVYRSLRSSILAGALRPGDRLPSTRSLAREVGVSRNVVLIAFEQLVAEGYVEPRAGSGTYVAPSLPALPSTSSKKPGTPPRNRLPRLSDWARRIDDAPSLLAPPPEPPGIDFRYGFAPPQKQLFDWWRRAVSAALDHYPLQYAPPGGDPRLRTALAHHLRVHRGVVCSPEQVIVVGGSQQALDLIARVLINDGDSVIIEDPHYQGARKIFSAAGAQLIGVPVDDQGIDLTMAPSAAKAGQTDNSGSTNGLHGRFAYVTPSHQFPTGAVMSLTRRLALLDWARRQDAYVVEDDYDSEFRYEGRPIESVQALDPSGRTLYIGTLSKVMFPALRLGFLVPPPELVDTFLAAKWLADRHSPILEQIALADFIESGRFERHLRRMRNLHAERRRTLIEAIGRYLGSRAEVMGTESGIHLVLWLPAIAGTEAETVQQTALAAGVGLHSIAPYYLKAPNRAGFLMGYGELTPTQIEEGVRRLAALPGFRATQEGH